jgi:hypothetical protein
MLSRTAITGRVAAPGRAPLPADAVPSPSADDPLLRAIADLRSGDGPRIRRALAAAPELPAALVPFVVDLLAWDAVAKDAVGALRSVCDRHIGQLLDTLLHADTEFSVRRRLAQVLAAASDPRAAPGLLKALDDPRFEVRFQAGVALARLRGRAPDLALTSSDVLPRVEREARVNRHVWESHRLLDDSTREESPFHDEVLRARSSRSLEHVFNLLSIVFPPEPLRIAYRGLYAEDRALRGTALEYLERILPAGLRECLWPFLDDDRPRRPPTRGVEEVVADLLRSHESLQIHLDELRRRSG